MKYRKILDAKKKYDDLKEELVVINLLQEFVCFIKEHMAKGETADDLSSETFYGLDKDERKRVINKAISLWKGRYQKIWRNLLEEERDKKIEEMRDLEI